MVIPKKKEQLIKSLNVLCNEIEKENIQNKKIKFDKIDKLKCDHIDQSIIKDVKGYLDMLNTYYIKRYNRANFLKDKLITALQKTDEDKQKFILNKKNYQNESLTELVTNATSLDRIVEYKGHLYQKINPIYQDPESKFLRAHFYSPEKQLLGNFFDTFWINVIIIWMFVIIQYITLYYKALKRFLDLIEEKTDKLFNKTK